MARGVTKKHPVYPETNVILWDDGSLGLHLSFEQVRSLLACRHQVTDVKVRLLLDGLFDLRFLDRERVEAAQKEREKRYGRNPDPQR